jgi:hypothetical protein
MNFIPSYTFTHDNYCYVQDKAKLVETVKVIKRKQFFMYTHISCYEVGNSTSLEKFAFVVVSKHRTCNCWQSCHGTAIIIMFLLFVYNESFWFTFVLLYQFIFFKKLYKFKDNVWEDHRRWRKKLKLRTSFFGLPM